MPRAVFALLLLLLPLSARAGDAERYAACMALARTAPMQAWEEALAWRGLAGGDPAEHCAASALIALGHLEEGAMRLEALAQESRAPSSLRAGLLQQAAEAWRQARQPRQALRDQTAALELAPDDVGLLLDRAAIRAELDDLAGGLADLDRAVALAPGDADALARRAALQRRRGDLNAAARDTAAALAADPRHPEALLERGLQHRQDGDLVQARKTWLAVLLAAPDSAAAEEARRQIEILDVPAGSR